MRTADYASVLALLPDATLLVTGSGRMVAANAAARRVLGASAGDGRPLEELVASPAADVQQFLRSCTRSREPQFGALMIVTGAGAERYRAVGATLRPRAGDEEALLLLRLLPRSDAAGRFLALNERITALHREIERRRRVEEELRAQREWLEVTLTSIGDAVISTDVDGNVTFLNPRAEVMTGWTRDEAVGRPLVEVFHIVNERTRDVVENPVSKVLASGEIVGLANHTVLIARDGNETAIEDTAAPIRETGRELRGVVLVFHDVGERRLLERELFARAARLAEADRRKDEFIAMLAHELRNPLAALSNSLHVMARRPLDGTDLLDRLQKMMHRQVGNLTRMVDDLLDVSRITRGKVVLQRRAVDFVALAQNALDDHAGRIAAAGLTVDALLPATPAWVSADATRITQVLDNLIENAVKFSERGGRVEVRVERNDAGDVVFAIRDHGCGIDPEVLPRLFEAFSQADRTLDRSRGGLGLGLSLVKGLVELHGGNVSAHSEGPGRGSEFSFVLPAAERPLDAAAAAANGGQEAARVLIIEDNDDVAQSMALALEAEGHTVVVARDGPSGLEAALESRPDAIVCDIGLPGMDGFAIARALRAMPQFATVRLLALTGYGDSTLRDQVHEAGFDAHLVKPLETAALLRAIAGR